MWDGRAWEGEVCGVGAHSITCKFLGKTQDYIWHLSAVYAPNDRRDREEVWWELAGVRGLFSGPWVVCEDFNNVRYPSEKKNCSRISRGMMDFSNFIEDMELVDMQLAGGSTLGKKGEFRSIKQQRLQREKSDHFPLMLKCGRWEPVKSYFKFENWWLQAEGFKERIEEWWNSFFYEGRPDFILVSKLQALKTKLKEWSRTLQGNLALQKASVLSQLAEIEGIHDQRSLTEEEILSKNSLSLEFDEIASNEEVEWRQRSRALWLKEGDKNTKFFHRTANAHRRYNNIDQLVVEGESLQAPEDIKREVIRYYKKLYTEEEEWRPTGPNSIHQMITEEDNLMLQSPFGEQEIWDSVKACAGDKAPGPDGFSMAFFNKCWVVVKKDVVAAVQNFYEQEIFEK
ncbi:PREDICTED: uncharacterized protein LOC109222690, partial [Nicotiana attenuata]|uniref:uncharacterized protein LOC109222690 n=1 Tax=Nicotiana attenuata TaxID=49451 RepID=UPI000905A1BB